MIQLSLMIMLSDQVETIKEETERKGHHKSMTLLMS